jgi:hypothetical protein
MWKTRREMNIVLTRHLEEKTSDSSSNKVAHVETILNMSIDK